MFDNFFSVLSFIFLLLFFLYDARSVYDVNMINVFVFLTLIILYTYMHIDYPHTHFSFFLGDNRLGKQTTHY